MVELPILKNCFYGVIDFFLIPKFIKDFISYRKCGNTRFAVNLKDIYPCLLDRTLQTNFDKHYVYHTAWASRILRQINPNKHFDISSFLYFSTLMSAFIPVDFYDYRPVNINLSNLNCGHADIHKLPFQDNSINSLSCMHVVEHIGLGRYGEPIDPLGDIKAIKELKRVLAKDGNLLFVVPVGKPKIFFNAHRVYSYEMIINLFSDFSIREFSLISGYNNCIIKNATDDQVCKEDYGCGCFWFTK